MENYADNNAFAPVFTSKVTGTVFYGLKDITQLSTARTVAQAAQGIFADGAVSRPLLTEIAQQIIKEANSNNLVNVAVWANNLLYRCTYPVDEDVALRASACAVFIDGEDPKESTAADIAKKVDLMKRDDEAYAFFLAMGLRLVPAYKAFEGENFQTYFQRKRNALQALTPVR